MCILGVSQLGTSKGVTVQKALLSMVLALFMALALVGLKQIANGTSRNQGTTLVADSGVPVPVDTFRDSGVPVPVDTH